LLPHSKTQARMARMASSLVHKKKFRKSALARLISLNFEGFGGRKRACPGLLSVAPTEISAKLSVQRSGIPAECEPWKMKESGFLPKAATPFLQRPPAGFLAGADSRRLSWTRPRFEFS